MAIDLTALRAKLAEEFKPFVKEIESGFETTKGHYGNYMTLISQISGNETEAKLYALALMDAGANNFGVTSALKVLYGS